MTGPLERRAARVLLVDDDPRVLLQQCCDPAAPAEGSWWNTTGGGLDAGETAGEAAVRELREETGLLLEVDARVVEGSGAQREVAGDGHAGEASATLPSSVPQPPLSGCGR